jgi:hypothetical protein
MMNLKRLLVFAMLLLASTVSVMASSFRAGDLVYLPGMFRGAGGEGSFFVTDVVISNVTNQRVEVSVAFAPTGAGQDNSGVTANMVDLPVLLPNERRTIPDIATALNLPGNPFGHLLFFACREGGNCNDCDLNPQDCELITVQGRIYNRRADGATFGQLFPGIPWYNYVSMNSQDRDLHRVFIPGIRQDAPGSGFRTNIGVLNASAFSSTQLRLTLFSPLGQQIGTPHLLNLAPLAHTQQAVTNFFPGFSGEGYLVIEQVSATSVPGETDARPGFMAYGSLVDNITSDPTTLEAQYFGELPFVCVYGSKPARRLVGR